MVRENCVVWCAGFVVGLLLASVWTLGGIALAVGLATIMAIGYLIALWWRP